MFTHTNGEPPAFEAVRVFDLPYKFGDPFLTGKLLIDGNLPDVHQCAGPAGNNRILHNTNSFLKISGYRNHMNKSGLRSYTHRPGPLYLISIICRICHAPRQALHEQGGAVTGCG